MLEVAPIDYFGHCKLIAYIYSETVPSQRETIDTFVETGKVFVRMRPHANPLTHNSFCLPGCRAIEILDGRNKHYGGQPLELKSSRRLRHSPQQSSAPPGPGHLGCGFRKPPA